MYSSSGRLRNQVVSTLVWLWWVIDWPRFEFESGKLRWFYPTTLSSCVENHVCLSRVVQVTGVACQVAMRIVAGVGDLVQRTRDGQGQVGYSVAGWSEGRVMLCAICTMHRETWCTGFLVWPQNQGRRVFRFSPQNRQLRFGDLGLKITAIVSWFGPKKQAGYSLLVVPQNWQWMKTARDTHQDLAACFAW
jgi:hypothetical protein